MERDLNETDCLLDKMDVLLTDAEHQLAENELRLLVVRNRSVQTQGQAAATQEVGSTCTTDGHQLSGTHAGGSVGKRGGRAGVKGWGREVTYMSKLIVNCYQSHSEVCCMAVCLRPLYVVTAGDECTEGQTLLPANEHYHAGECDKA